MNLSYEELRFIWWILIGVLMIGFSITDGFDMGVGSLLKIIAKNNNERRILINTIAPHWDGNQVWLLTAGGAIFAAWPVVYSTAFSGFYLAMMVVLAGLFMRPVGFEYRAKIDTNRWRDSWDLALCIGSSIPPLIIGVAFGNLLQGVPFYFDDILSVHYTGSFFALLNPFALMVGILSLLMIINHGAAYLQLKTKDQLKHRSEKVSFYLSIICCLIFIFAGFCIWKFINGFVLTSNIDHNSVNQTIKKAVEIKQAGWLSNYQKLPILFSFPILGILFFIICSIASYFKKNIIAFISSSLAMAMVILTCGTSMFPFVMPSSSNPNHSLTMWDATASYNTLSIMFIVALVFVPIVLTYTLWGFYVMRGRLDENYINKNNKTLY